MTEPKDCLNVVILGSGGAGCSSAIYLSMSGIKKTLLVTGKEIGGQISTTSKVENFVGSPDIGGYELGQKMLKHAKTHVQTLSDQIIRIEKKKNYFELISETKEKIYCKYLIIATGSSAKTLKLSKEKNFWNKGIHTCAICDGFFYKDDEDSDKKENIIVVIGGGNSACEQALYLSKLLTKKNSKVLLIHRSEKFRAFPQMLEAVKKTKNIKILTNTEVVDLEGKEKLEKIVLSSGKKIKVSAVFFAIGHIPNSNMIDFIEKDEHGYIVVDAYGQTSNKRIFACGDVATTGNLKYKQLIVAAAEGCNSALRLSEVINEDLNK